MKRAHLSGCCAALLLALPAWSQPAQPGGTPPAAAAAAPATDYDALLERLLPGLGAAWIPDREQPQQELERIGLHAGRPGAEAERAALCRALAARLGPPTPEPARVWLLRQLERIGREECVDALADLLADPDPDIRDLARRALEANPTEPALLALRAALGMADEPAWQVALLNALAARHDEAAVPQIIELAGSADDAVAAAAISALGQMHGPQALAWLAHAAQNGPPQRRDAAADAWLRCADRLADRGERGPAGETYRALLAADVRPPLRMGALRGLTRLDAARMTPELLAAVTDEQATADWRGLAAQLLTEIPDERVTAAIVETLPQAAPAAQVLLLRALGQRTAVAARPAVVSLLDSASADVRQAAAETLEHVGDPAAVLPLAELAAASAATEAEREAARRSLARLSGGAIDETVRASLAQAAPAVRIELMRALSARRCHAAVADLLTRAEDEDDAVRAAALEALSVLAGPQDAPALVRLLLDARPEPVQAAAAGAVVAACGRHPDPELRAAPVLAAWDQAAEPVRPVLVDVLGRIGGAAALERIRAACAAPQPELVDAAVRALARWPGEEALEDLLRIARASQSRTQRVLALQGYVRLLGLPSARAPEDALARYEEALALAERPEERRQVLAGVAGVPHPGALQLAERYLGDAALRAEAEAAVVTAARQLAATHRDEARAALERVLAQTAVDATRQAARQALVLVENLAGTVTAWQVAGPYVEPGRDWEYVFDHAWPPETPAGSADWRSLAPANRDAPWVFDLGGLDPGGHCCVYVRASVWSETARPARLEVGSDDGVKVWLNGSLVHTARLVRGHTPLEDKVPVHLAAGWNTLLLKVVQCRGGWAFSCGLRAPDGQPLPGLKFSAAEPEGR